MAVLEWDKVGEHRYESGVDHGVLYVWDKSKKAYGKGVAWNGLTKVTEKPSGAEGTKKYADNIAYLNMVSAEEFAATIEAYTYPDEFLVCDGVAVPKKGLQVGQQERSSFAMSYRTKIGNDADGQDASYKIHLVYGLLAAPSEKGYETINDSPEPIAFSWEAKSTPIPLKGFKPVSSLSFVASDFQEADLKKITDKIYGTATEDAKILLPDEVFATLGVTNSPAGP